MSRKIKALETMSKIKMERNKLDLKASLSGIIYKGPSIQYTLDKHTALADCLKIETIHFLPGRHLAALIFACISPFYSF